MNQRLLIIQQITHNRVSIIKILFWVYFLLLIFEGVLRKWLIPQFSAPLLIMRDPVGLLILLEAYRTNKWPQKWSLVLGVLATIMIGLCSIQMIVLDNPLLASYLLPFPIAFIMGENLDANDLRKFSLCIIWILLPETILEIAQYLAPVSSALNVGAYEGANQITYVGTKVRASGTFSFVVGPANYGPLAAAFILNNLLNIKVVKKWILWPATVALIISVSIVGSRTFVYLFVAIIACAGIFVLFNATRLIHAMKLSVPVVAVFCLTSLLPIFSASSKNLDERFKMASEAEGGDAKQAVVQRTIVPFISRIEDTDYFNNPIGIGMGRGATAISKYLFGRAEFIAGENELDRCMTEMGPLVGITFELFRLCLALFVLKMALICACDYGEPLALLLVPLMSCDVVFGTLEQPTVQGFMVISLAFSLAALKQSNSVCFQNCILRRPFYRLHSYEC
jgi:hypothetical protein